MFCKIPKYTFFNKIANLFKSGSTSSTLSNEVLITPAQAHSLLHNKKVKFLDVRDPADYAKEHIPGAYSANLIFSYLAKSDAKGVVELKKTFEDLF